LSEHYPEDYESYLLPDQRSSTFEQWHVRRALTMQLEYIENQHAGTGRLLDVGCATGNFLHVAQERGWEVLGIEIVEKAARMAREHYGLQVISTDLESGGILHASQDAITLWDVLEHLPSPRRTLGHIHELLRADGMLFFSIPNLNSFDRNLFGTEWIGWDAPRHFNLFDGKTIQRLLSETGFELVDRRCLLGGKGTFFLSMDRIIKKRPSWAGLKRMYTLLGWLLWPYRQFSYLLRRGPIIYYAVHKVSK